MPKPRARREDDASTSDNAERILRVAERLFARRGHRNVTVRDIAAAAHVTHPLIYHYFGSKRGLLAAVLERSQSRMRAVAATGGAAPETIAALVRNFVMHDRTYALTVTRGFADGMRPSDWPGGFPSTEALLDLLSGARTEDDHGLSATEVRALVAVVVAMATGWTLFEDQLLEIVGLSGDDLEQARECLVAAIGRVVGPALPAEQDSLPAEQDSRPTE
ncbi:MAG TPA: helix-turn-helix domain-containing protein [Thermoleophilia bacterium]|nr:helix-turn-helix domain-containing protein [Thermoleophilia bacterium]